MKRQSSGWWRAQISCIIEKLSITPSQMDVAMLCYRLDGMGLNGISSFLQNVFSLHCHVERMLLAVLVIRLSFKWCMWSRNKWLPRKNLGAVCVWGGFWVGVVIDPVRTGAIANSRRCSP